MNFRLLTLVFCCLYLMPLQSLLGNSADPAERPDRLPNVVVIFIDDLGYADIGPFFHEENKTKFKTPNLDQMAREGMKFTGSNGDRSSC